MNFLEGWCSGNMTAGFHIVAEDETPLEPEALLAFQVIRSGLPLRGCVIGIRKGRSRVTGSPPKQIQFLTKPKWRNTA